VIIDRIENGTWYAGITPRLARALAFLRDTPLAMLPLGRLHLDGEQLFANVDAYPTRPAAEGRWEAHRQYIDVQCLISGRERIGYAPRAQLREIEAYDAARDIAFYAGAGEHFTLVPGLFAVFGPQDAHMPGLAVAEPEPVRKIVIKLAVS
jgi:YhcH/YjgK/YiaL family protein